MVIVTPPGIRGTEECDGGYIECGREMSRSAVCRHNDGASSNGGLAQSDTQFLFCETLDLGVRCLAADGGGRFSFGRSADDQDMDVSFRRQTPGEGGKVLSGPGLGRTIGATSIQNDDVLVRAPTKLFPDQIRILFVLDSRRQFQLAWGRSAAECADDVQVVVNSGPRQERATFARGP